MGSLRSARRGPLQEEPASWMGASKACPERGPGGAARRGVSRRRHVGGLHAAPRRVEVEFRSHRVHGESGASCVRGSLKPRSPTVPAGISERLLREQADGQARPASPAHRTIPRWETFHLPRFAWTRPALPSPRPSRTTMARSTAGLADWSATFCWGDAAADPSSAPPRRAVSATSSPSSSVGGGSEVAGPRLVVEGSHAATASDEQGSPQDLSGRRIV